MTTEMIVAPASGEALANPQESLLAFAEQKKVSVDEELGIQREALEHAKKCKWQTTALARSVRNLEKSRQYYEKVAQALRAGYVVMPPIDCDVFAVRVGERARLPKAMTNRNPTIWNRPGDDLADVQSNAPPAGEGDYVAPEVLFRFSEREVEKADHSGKDVIRTTWPTEFISEIPFPLAVSRPQLMTATQAAMQLGVFDDIAICPDRGVRKRDPIVVGRIHRTGRFRDPLYFLIAWYVRVEEI